MSFAAWFRLLRSNLDTQLMVLAAAVCRRIWWTRNQVVHGESQGGGEDIIEWATNFLEAYKQAQLPHLSRKKPTSSTWIPPSEGQMKVNFDVGFIDSAYYQIAVVARKADGGCLWWRVCRFAGKPPVVVGEARAALEGLILAHEKGWGSVVLEGDCVQIVTAIKEKREARLQVFGSQLSAILSYAHSFPVFSCSFVRRSDNRLVHALAHISLSSEDVLEDSVLPADLALII